MWLAGIIRRNGEKEDARTEQKMEKRGRREERKGDYVDVKTGKRRR